MNTALKAASLPLALAMQGCGVGSVVVDEAQEAIEEWQEEGAKEKARACDFSQGRSWGNPFQNPVDVQAEAACYARKAEERGLGFKDISTPSGKERVEVDECTDRENRAIQKALEMSEGAAYQLGLPRPGLTTEFRCAREPVGIAGQPALGYTDIGTPESTGWKVWEEPKAPGDAVVVTPYFFKHELCPQAAAIYALTTCADGVQADCDAYTGPGSNAKPGGPVGSNAGSIQEHCEGQN